jgi:hypothetical protein
MYIHIFTIFLQYIDADKELLISEFDTSIFSLTVIPILGELVYPVSKAN